MKKKIIIFSSCILLILIVVFMTYYSNIYDKNLVNPNEIETDSKFKNITYNEIEDLQELEEGTLGIITIEKIRIKCKS